MVWKIGQVGNDYYRQQRTIRCYKHGRIDHAWHHLLDPLFGSSSLKGCSSPVYWTSVSQRALQNAYLCVYFSRLKTAQRLPTAVGKITEFRPIVHGSFVICPCFLLQLPFLLFPQLCTLCSSHTELLLPHQTLFLPPLGHSSAQTFLSGRTMFHIPFPPHLPVFPLLISVQITSSGQLSLLP